MNQVEELIREYLPTVKVMQLATSNGDQPWACTIHFYSDDKLNIYWISTLGRRHSKDIDNNPKVAATVMVHENNAEEDYVIGISVEGTAELLAENVDEATVQGYTKKLDMKPEFMDDVRNGRDEHKFYKLTPKSVVLFDNKDFPGDPRKVLEL